MKNLIKNKGLLIPVLIYLFLTIPFLNIIPYLDGNIDFVKSYDFYTNGIQGLLSNWPSVHPPLKEILIFPFFKFFRITPVSFTLPGILIGSTGIFFFYLLAKRLVGKNTAAFVAILLSLNPFYLSLSPFSLIDFLLTIFIIISVNYYSQNKLFLFSLFSTLSVLAKETSLLLPFSVIIVETYLSIKNKDRKFLKVLPYALIPFLTYYSWSYFLKLNGQKVWSDWNFSQTAGRGTVYTMFYNLLTLRLLNKFAYQNWLQLFLLNFNWVYWTILLVGSTLFFYRRFIEKSFFKFQEGAKTGLVIFSFCFIYFLVVLSFQTYTIPRYAFPVFPFLLMAVGWSIKYISRKLKINKLILPIILVIFVPFTLFTSLDPISSFLWGKTQILGYDIYGLNRSLDGNDGITYNLQFLQIAQTRSELLLQKTALVDKGDCYWIFADPRNEKITLKVLGIKPNLEFQCK